MPRVSTKDAAGGVAMFRGEEDRGSGGRGCEDDDGNATRGRGGGRGRGSGRSQGGPPSPILTRAMLEAVEYIRSAAEAGSLRRCCIRAADGAGFEPGCEGIPSLSSGRRLLKMFADGAATPSHGQQVVEWANALETETAPGKLMANIETSVSTPTESSLAWSASPTPATWEGVRTHALRPATWTWAAHTWRVQGTCGGRLTVLAPH